jgi:Flp pilus assembly protein TadB
MQSEMEPSRDNQQGAQQYAGYSGIDMNRSAQSITKLPVSTSVEVSSRDFYIEEARLRREDLWWARANLLMVPIGVLLIFIGVVVTLVNPATGIATIVSGFITDCIPVLASRQRAAAWKRLRVFRQDMFFEELIRTSSGELQKNAFKAYSQLENSKDEEESR